MPTLLLVRHGRTTANASGVLAGWTPGVLLDETGRAQAEALASRLAPVPLTTVVTSPLERCRQTTDALVAVPGPKGTPRPRPEVDERVGECRYGDWTGQELKKLAKDPLWKRVQAHPSSVLFPGPHGESMTAMQARAVTAVHEHDDRVRAEHGQDAVWVAVSHGDVIKSVLADALGMHLDAFQRLMVDPCSVSVVHYTPLRPFVSRLNDTAGDLSWLAPRLRRRRGKASGAASGQSSSGRVSSDAVVGGGAGTS